MRKKVLKKLHMITLHPAAFPAPLRPCHPGWEKPMSMLTSNRIRNLPFCEEMNTSLGYGTMHQNCLRMIKLFCFIVVISNKFTTSLSYFLWSSAKWFFCTFDEGFPPDTSYYFFGSFVVETFFNEKPLKKQILSCQSYTIKDNLTQSQWKVFGFNIFFDGLVAWIKPLFLEQGIVPLIR